MDISTKLLLAFLFVVIIALIVHFRRSKKIQEIKMEEKIKKSIDVPINDILKVNKLLGLEETLRYEEIDQKIVDEFKNAHNKSFESIKPPERKSFTYIRDKCGLQAVVFEILNNKFQCNQNVIGIDTENELMLSYNGYLCLIQVSTTTQDYIIDLLLINDNKYVANTFGKRILENEAIIKVLHGGSNDYIWILRDFGVKIKNIFDTQDIFQQLGGKKLALNNLWEMFCGFKMESEIKVKFQKSLWSKRPLPDEMLLYAATDSRFLIYIRYILLLIAMEGPSEKIKSMYPEIKGNLSIKALSKLYTKMQKENLSLQDSSDCLEEIFKKCMKGEGKSITLESIEMFRRKYDLLHSYCKTHDVNPECIIDYKILYKFTPDQKLTVYELEEIKSNNINEKIFGCKYEIIKELTKICNEKITENDAKTKENTRIFKLLTTKTYIDKVAQEKEEKRKVDKQNKRK